MEAPVDAGKGRGAQCPVSHGPIAPLLHCLLPHYPMSQKRAGATDLPLPPFAPLEPGKTSMRSYFLKAYGRVTQMLLLHTVA